MAVNIHSEDGRILRQLYPLLTFSGDAFKDLCATTNIEYVQDAPIFKRGDSNTELVYLLSGSVTLRADDLIVEVIDAGSESAKFALAHQIPRKIDAVANGFARIVRLDAHTVNNPPPAVYQEDMGYTVIEESSEDPDDWMTAILQLPLFEGLPALSLQKILTSQKINQFKEGDVILENGSPVDYFYIVNKGQCLLTRNRKDEISEIKLSAGDSFGEEYLITGRPAQETVIALTDVSIIQIKKDVFLSHIKKPSLTFIGHEAMPEAQKNGAILLDVRSPHHFENHNLPGSANIPLMSLRMRLGEIPKDRQIIVVCANGQASEAGAYILGKNKLNAVVLKEGMGIREAEEMDNRAKLSGNPAEKSESETVAAMHEIVAASADSKPEMSIDFANLLQRNCELEELVVRLQVEKDEAVKKSEVLTQQLGRLKEILNRLTKRQ